MVLSMCAKFNYTRIRHFFNLSAFNFSMPSIWVAKKIVALHYIFLTMDKHIDNYQKTHHRKLLQQYFSDLGIHQASDMKQNSIVFY